MALDINKDVVNRGLCAGCGLCEAIAQPGAVQVQLDRAGYYRPSVRDALSARALSLIGSSCPGLNVVAEPSSVPYHPIWGPLVTVSVGHAEDPELRHLGSSGGVVSAIAVFLLQSKKVDFVAQITASKVDPLGNELQLSQTRQDVLHAAGSRYGPSAPLRRLMELLDSGKTFAFIGKPCDVAALRQFGRHEPRVKRQIPYMLSFMCAGVPSRYGTLEMLAQLGLTEREVASLRYRGDGWPGKVKAVTHSGDVREMDYATSWGSVLNKHLQFRCKVCADGTGEFADIVGGDAWYGPNGFPDFEERPGRSLVIARTARGQALLDEMLAAKAVNLTPFSPLDLADVQPYQRARKSLVLARLLGLVVATGRATRYRNMRLFRAAYSASPIEWIRNMLGTYRRANRGSH